jgi:hypothetical protein
VLPENLSEKEDFYLLIWENRIIKFIDKILKILISLIVEN